ncbi:MAG: hypothetical protein DWI00_02230 [Planctomycetota bacterium]|nr:MAG: hypothetical protein DWI00_02230 [Planctomycetota bacterium]
MNADAETRPYLCSSVEKTLKEFEASHLLCGMKDLRDRLWWHHSKQFVPAPFVPHEFVHRCTQMNADNHK